MSTVSSTGRSIKRVLRLRPYLRWDLVPLATHLIDGGYSQREATAVVDAVAAGRSLESLAEEGAILERDVEAAYEALLEGQRRTRRMRPVETIGDLLNVVIGSLRAAGVEPHEGSVDDRGLSITVGGVPLRLAILPPIRGGAPGPIPADAVVPPPELADGEEAALLEARDREAEEEMGRLEQGRPYPMADAFEPSDEDLAEYASLMSEEFAREIRPVSGGAPAGDDAWPRAKSAADRRRDRDEVREWYRTHPEG